MNPALKVRIESDNIKHKEKVKVITIYKFRGQLLKKLWQIVVDKYYDGRPYFSVRR